MESVLKQRTKLFLDCFPAAQTEHGHTLFRRSVIAHSSQPILQLCLYVPYTEGS